MMAGWGAAATEAAKPTADTTAPAPVYDAGYYRDLFNNKRAQSVPVRMALVARENTAKTGLALDLCKAEIEAGKQVTVLDFDNSAKATVDYIYPNADNIAVIPLCDETDNSIFNDDNSINYVALIDKVNWFINMLAEDLTADPDSHAAIIFDGGSTFLKWCEHAMTGVLLRRGVIKDEGDAFNQKEWRTRNQLFRDAIGRIHSLSVGKVFFTFHLKPVKEYVDDGGGRKVLMTVGESPEWEKGTMRCFSQQIFLSRYMKQADLASGVKGDKTLKPGEWAVRATIEEMKGQHMEHLGETHTILSVEDGKVNWVGLPFLTWEPATKTKTKTKTKTDTQTKESEKNDG